MSDPAEAAGLLLNTVITDAHLERNPEIDPSTSADSKPVVIEASPSDIPDIRREAEDLDPDEFPDIIPSSPLPDARRQQGRRPAMMNGQPLPDLRHEQTYLAALYKTDMSRSSIVRVTLLDFLIWPTIMNFAYVLGLNGFRYLREGSTRSGRKIGEVVKDFLNIGGVLD